MDFLELDLMSFNKSLQQFTRTAKQQTLTEKYKKKEQMWNWSFFYVL